MTIPTLPSAPLITDIPADFNTKAFNWVSALANWTTEANATGVAVDADAAVCVASAGTATAQAGVAEGAADTATAQAGIATTQAGIATTKAGEANASAIAAAASAASINLNSIDINGGTIDGAVIGGSSAAAGTFTTVSASGAILQGGTANYGGYGYQTVNQNGLAIRNAASSGVGAFFAAGSTASVSGAGDFAVVNGVSGVILGSGVNELARFTSTGLAVTGTITQNRLTGTLQGEFVASDVDGRTVVLRSPDPMGTQAQVGTTTNHNLDLIYGGTTKATISSTGLAVTGSIASTVPAAGSFTTVSASGNSTTDGIIIGRTSNGQGIGFGNGANADFNVFIASGLTSITNTYGPISTVIAGDVRTTVSSTGLSVTGTVTPEADNTRTLGTGALRWSEVFAGTGTINTSDAREKTPVRTLISGEIDAAKALSKEIGIYQFLKSVEVKGNAARSHVGMTVQRAIEIMEANGLSPFAYGFICHDVWEDKFIEHPAIEAVAAVEAVDATFDEDGKEITPAIAAIAAVEAKATWTEQTQVAGDRYAFRYDQLNLFIAAGIEARLSALEAA